MVAQHYDLAPDERDVLDRILRLRVSEDAVRKVTKRLALTFEAHLRARMNTLAAELGFELVAAPEVQRPDKPQAGRADTVGFAFNYPEERCTLVLHFDRAAVSLANHALLGASPEDELTATTGDVSQLEISVLQSLVEVAARTRQSDRPFLGFDRVEVMRGDSPLLGDPIGGAVVTLTFALSFGVNRAWCWLDVPHKFLIDLSARLSNDEAVAARASEKKTFKVPDFALGVDVVLPLAAMTLEDLSRLTPGDVLECAPSADGAATLRAKGRDLFSMQVGRLGQSNAARVIGPIAPIDAAINAHAQRHSQQGGT